MIAAYARAWVIALAADAAVALPMGQIVVRTHVPVVIGLLVSVGAGMFTYMRVFFWAKRVIDEAEAAQ